MRTLNNINLAQLDSSPEFLPFTVLGYSVQTLIEGVDGH
jgi:hypothetical protein